MAMTAVTDRSRPQKQLPVSINATRRYWIEPDRGDDQAEQPTIRPFSRLSPLRAAMR